mmetsp:Transcript_18322/g.56198  ORF Transcript_18322/g.56198 Transcript_18322/m.56198 type:complete len:151 (+) Transcript_18322:652-1104(+)
MRRRSNKLPTTTTPLPLLKATVRKTNCATSCLPVRRYPALPLVFFLRLLLPRPTTRPTAVLSVASLLCPLSYSPFLLFSSCYFRDFLLSSSPPSSGTLYRLLFAFSYLLTSDDPGPFPRHFLAISTSYSSTIPLVSSLELRSGVILLSRA